MTLLEEQLKEALNQTIPDEKDREIVWKGIEALREEDKELRNGIWTT